MIDKQIIEQFTHDTRYNLSSYLIEYRSFIRNGRSKILDYYNGVVSQPDKAAFEQLENLLDKSVSVDEMISIHSSKMTSAKYWELADFLEEVKGSLMTVDNSSKWLRSSLEKNDFTPNVEVEHTISQNETLEKISNDTGAVDPNNHWISIALRNDLREEQYDADGGNLIVVGYQNRRAIRLNTVVDNIKGKNIYGIDLDRTITFEDDDLRTLPYKETIVQAVEILAGLKQGSTPEFPEDGIQTELVVGSNRASIAYPVLMRQFYNTFRKDDTLKNLTITKIDTLADRIEVEFTVRTRLDEIIVVNSPL